MLLKWLDAREATAAGAALADDFYLQSGSRLPRSRASEGGQEPELQKFLQRFLQRVDQAVQPLKLNIFKRAKLANSFKWRLLEKGVERDLVDELTRALVTRLTGVGPGAAAAGRASGSGRRASARDAQALHARAKEALGRRDFAVARECFQDLANHDPRDAVARHGLGTALAQLGRYREAEEEFRRAIGLRPGFPEAHLNLAGVLQSTGRYEESEDPLRRALKVKPAYLEARVSLGMSLLMLGRTREARDSYEKALRAAPRNTQALVGLGQVEALEGQFAKAEAAYRQALEIEPGSPGAHAALVWLRRMTASDDTWLKRAEEIAAAGIAPIDETNLRFAIGKYCDDVGDYPRAFRNYQRANDLQKLRAIPYDRVAHQRYVSDLIAAYTPEALARPIEGASDSARPVLVTGMPRSGTSLVEQIIASHPSAYGAGELRFWTEAVSKHETALRQGRLEGSLGGKLAASYLRVLGEHSKQALRVVDKAPINADYLGIIHLVFPKARLIYMRRDPIDTCLSCYFQQFSPGMNFAMDLADLAHYYREHNRLVAHWRASLPPGTLLEVPYAELVSEQEQWTRRILEFVGLPWDHRTLEFHKTERPVTTASVWQVRQKMYRSSVERWRHYEKFIGPLKSLADSSG
ncbi:MAG TPA: sulfotransferase [Steroidobacteraceae bacterium]|nr:sulfotransferase [Steroidobacteraceae bacterium]